MRTGILAVLAALFVVTMALAAPAAAAGGGGETVPGPTLSYPYNPVFGAEGSVHVLDEAEVPPELQGLSCAFMGHFGNNKSENPNNDLAVKAMEADGPSVTAVDVERAAGPDGKVGFGGTLVLGSKVSLTLTLGASGRFSGNVEVTSECFLPEPVGETTDECNEETGMSEVKLRNAGPTDFTGNVEWGDDRMKVGLTEELTSGDGPSSWMSAGNIGPGIPWRTTVDGVENAYGVTEDCKVDEPEPTTTTTTIPSPPTTLLPPSQGDIAEAVNTEPLESGRTDGLVLVVVSLGLASAIAILTERNSRRGRRESLI